MMINKINNNYVSWSLISLPIQRKQQGLIDFWDIVSHDSEVDGSIALPGDEDHRAI